MSYQCELCGEQVRPGVKQNPVVVKSRLVEYREIRDGFEVSVELGHETVREIKICPECKGKLRK